MGKKNRDGHIESAATPKCGLCGKKKRLTRTECCGNRICDDEHRYAVFSRARNSCSRNHRRFTLCGYHSSKKHRGRWTDCPKCREDFETELYVWYGTNEYNFEKLANRPAYDPTRCSECGIVIVLSEDEYSVRAGRYGREYWCDKCTKEGMKGPSGLSKPPEKPDDQVEFPKTYNNRIVQGGAQGKR